MENAGANPQFFVFATFALSSMEGSGRPLRYDASFSPGIGERARVQREAVQRAWTAREVVAGIVGCDGWLAGCFFFFPSPTHEFVWLVEWRWVVLFRSVGGVGGQWSGGGLGFANLLVVAWICWDVRFGDSNFILLGLNLIFWVLNLLGLYSCSNI